MADEGPSASLLWPWVAAAAVIVTCLWMTLPWDNLAAPAFGWHLFDPLDLLDIGRIALFGTLGFEGSRFIGLPRTV